MSARTAIRPYGEACTPPWWARGGHLQTVLGHLRGDGRTGLENFERRELALGDGDRLVVLAHAGTSGVRVLLLHGLSGDAETDYMCHTARALVERGHSVWSVNHRGAGAGHGRASRPYHSGIRADLEALLAHSHGLAGAKRTIVIGFSISGNIALLAAAMNDALGADGVIAVNPPIDLARAAADVHRGFNRAYELRFLLRLRRALREFERAGVVHARAPIGPFASLREFDEHFTAPVSGFADAADYYARCSSAPRLQAITLPTVVIAAQDDPLVDARVFRETPLARATHLHLEAHGGHMGYLARGAGRWLDRALVHYVEELASSRTQRVY